MPDAEPQLLLGGLWRARAQKTEFSADEGSTVQLCDPFNASLVY